MCQQGLAGTGAAHHNNITLFYLYVVGAFYFFLSQTLVVVVHRHRQVLLGLILAYHILVQEFLYFFRLGQVLPVYISCLGSTLGT